MFAVKLKLFLQLWTPSMVSYRLRRVLFRWVMDTEGDIGLELFRILSFIKYKESTVLKWNAKYSDAPKRITRTIPGIVQAYMSRPCSITTDDRLWCIAGVNKLGGSGVLAWCYDQADANTVYNEFFACGMFEKLSMYKYLVP